MPSYGKVEFQDQIKWVYALSISSQMDIYVREWVRYKAFISLHLKLLGELIFKKYEKDGTSSMIFGFRCNV